MSGAFSKITWVRATRYTPAVTMVAAWIRADTGVGPSMASGSQVWSGSWADLATAPTSSPSATRLASVDPCDHGWWGESMTEKSVVPASLTMKNTAMAIPTSPIAFITNAFLAAITGSGRSYQNPISR